MFPAIGGGMATFKSPVTNQDLAATRSHGLRSLSVPMNRTIGREQREQRHWQNEKAANHFNRGPKKATPPGSRQYQSKEP